jgi:hypothetical protein
MWGLTCLTGRFLFNGADDPDYYTHAIGTRLLVIQVLHSTLEIATALRRMKEIAEK